MGWLARASRSGRRFAEHLRSREPHGPLTCSSRRPVSRSTAVGEELSRAKKDRERDRPVRGEHRPRARAGRGLPSVYPGAGLYFPLHQHSRALCVAQARRRRAPSVPSRPDRLARLLDQHSSAGTAPPYFSAARSSRARRAQVAAAPQSLSRCSTAPPSVTARALALIARRPLGRADADHLPRAARPRTSRGVAAGDARHQAWRSRAADRRELARLGARLLRDSVRRRDRGAARPSDFRRGARADLRDRRARGCAASRPRSERLGSTLERGTSEDRRARSRRAWRARLFCARGRQAPPRRPIARRWPRSCSPPAPPERPKA